MGENLGCFLSLIQYICGIVFLVLVLIALSNIVGALWNFPVIWTSFLAIVGALFLWFKFRAGV